MKKYEILARDGETKKVHGVVISYFVGADKFKFIIHQSPYSAFKTAVTEFTTRKRIVDIAFPCILCDELLTQIYEALERFVDHFTIEYLRECRARTPYTTENDEEL